MTEQHKGETVTLKIDGREVTVPKGTNVIEAAKTLDIEIPHYCYHPHLSIAGNCRMCQVELKGRPKLEIACNMACQDGMEVATHLTSPAVKKAQEATLEFILINHPLDCTVCDQAGHCKLQDYHYEYNAKPSRFVEEKEKKVKAEVLGPTVILDGERCIMCTRCIRFCDEVTGTSELGMLNRGDKSVIAVNPGRELNNPLSGTVVDLCPVGALTHREWRFNTRIWFTKQTDSICTGCSTGCNVKVAARDREIVQVKGRLNADVNKEWLCDEGRYGFMRFLPEHRVTSPSIAGSLATMAEAVRASAKLFTEHVYVFVSPDLTLEDYAVLKRLLDAKATKGSTVVVAYRERKLTDVEAILMSPDRAANFRGAQISGLVGDDLQSNYESHLAKLRNGGAAHVLVVGDRGILPEDASGVLREVKLSVALVSDAKSEVSQHAKVVLPLRSILERSGILVNRELRAQFTDAVVDFPDGTEPAWRLFSLLGKELGVTLLDAKSERDATMWLLGADPRLAGVTIRALKRGGVVVTRSGSAAGQVGAGA